MVGDKNPSATQFFWDLATPMLSGGDADEGTLMGFPCLRVKGQFFATCDRRTGELIVKLPKERVGELIEQGSGRPFAPAGRTFSEWVLVPERDEEQWLALMAEARRFARQGAR